MAFIAHLRSAAVHVADGASNDELQLCAAEHVVLTALRAGDRGMWWVPRAASDDSTARVGSELVEAMGAMGERVGAALQAEVGKLKSE